MNSLFLSCLVLCGTIAPFVLGNGLYGFSTQSYLVKINPKTGVATNVGFRYPYELSAQQLSTIDHVRGIYYLLEFNRSTSKPQLVGLDVKDGSLKIDITLDLQESAFVGVGQSVDVDPKTGDVIINGHDATVAGHHIFMINPHAAKPVPKTIAKIAAPAVELLGGSSAIDWDLGIFYSPLVLPPAEGPTDAASWSKEKPTQVQMRGDGTWYIKNNQPPPPKFRVELVGVHYKETGSKNWDIIPQTISLGTLVYDYQAKIPAVVGFSGKESPSGTFQKTLAKFVTSDKGKTFHFSEIGEVKGYEGQMGPISTVNTIDRVHYSLLQPPQKSKWEPSDGCSPACKTGTSCCRSPPSGPACFTVTSCSKMPSDPDMSLPFYVVGLNLDNATVESAGKECSITDGNCPWSLEYYSAMHP